MKILAFDGTAKAASVAVADGDRILAHYTVDNGLTHSELLLPMAEDLLSKLKLTVGDIELFAVTVGPGSFTGVRIGTALIKGLMLGTDKPATAVSTLESLAENLSSLSGIAVPVMDARRSQLYTAIFNLDGGEHPERLTEDMAISCEELAELLRTYADKSIYLVGDGYQVAQKKLTELGIKLSATPKPLILQSAASTAAVAKRKHESGEAVRDTALNPSYLRVPQAERERLERENNKENIKNG